MNSWVGGRVRSKCRIKIQATGFLRVRTGYVRGMYGFGSVVHSVVRTGPSPHQAVPELRSAPLWRFIQLRVKATPSAMPVPKECLVSAQRLKARPFLCRATLLTKKQRSLDELELELHTNPYDTKTNAAAWIKQLQLPANFPNIPRFPYRLPG